MSRLRKALIIVPLVVAAVAAVAAAWWRCTSRQYDVKIRAELALFAAEGGHERAMDYVTEQLAKGGTTHCIDIEVFRPSTAYRLPMDGVYAEKREPDVERAMEADDAFHKWLESDAAQAEDNWDNGWATRLQKYLTDNAAMLRGVKEEAEYGTGMFGIEWSAGIETTLPHLGLLRRAARMLAAEAVLRARSGDMAGALEDVRLMFRVRRLLDQEPALISHLVAFALDRTAGHTLRVALEAGAIEQAGAKAILAELDGREERNNMYRAALCETTLRLMAFDDVRQTLVYMDNINGVSGSQAERPRARARRYLKRLTWNTRKDKLCLLEAMREMRRLARLSHVERVREAAFVTAPETTRQPVTSMMMPHVRQPLDAQTEADARAALVRAALGVEMYRAARSEFPETLEAVVPEYLAEVPMDPFDGKPLHYSRSDGGYVLYSVGLDCIDGSGGGDDIEWVRRRRESENVRK